MSLGHRFAAAVLCCLVVTLPAAIPSGAAGTDQTASLSTVQQDSEQTYTTSFPPNTTWENEQIFEAYTAGGANFSARPPNATWEDCCNISDNSTARPLISNAYIEIFATSPSTIVHSHNGTQRYGGPNGTVRTISNLRLNPPRNESTELTNQTNTTGNNSAGTVERNLTRFTGETELLVNGTVVDTAPLSPTTELQYENVSGTANLTVRMTLEATIRENASNATERRHYSMTVTDSRIIRVQNLSVVPERQDIAWINQTGANESVLATTVPGRWNRVSFEDGPTVTSKWRYYTQYNESWQSWDDWEIAGNESAVDGTTRIAPQEVHAVPVTSGPEMTQPDLETEAGTAADNPYLWLEFPDSNMTRQPPLPPGIELNRSWRSTTSDTFTIHSETSLRGLDNYTVHGIVRGHTVNRSINRTGPKIVREPNLTVRDGYVIDPSDPTVLSPFPDKTPIRVFGPGDDLRQGQLRVVTRECVTVVEVERLGVKRIALDQSGIRSARITYEPTVPWWNQSRDVPVQATTTRYVPPNELPPDHEIIGFVMSAVVAILPLWLLLYGYRLLNRRKIIT